MEAYIAPVRCSLGAGVREACSSSSTSPRFQPRGTRSTSYGCFKSPVVLRKPDFCCCNRWSNRLFFTLVPIRLPRRASQKYWSLDSSTDGGSFPEFPEGSNGGTRLSRVIGSFITRLNARFTEFRRGLPIKLLFALIGFYCATAFATVIGQTGDWDILSAGLAVVVVEGIGALMYRASVSFVDKLRGVITIFNYWKAGLSLGLFLDAFKY